MTGSLPPTQGYSLAPGDRVDRYQLLAPLGRGGMAEVWLARLPSRFGVSSLVAIKTLRVDLRFDNDLRSMLVDEATISSRIRHPNVAQVLEIGEHQGVPFIVMQFVDGDPVESLVAKLRREGATLELPLTLRLLADTCGGLHAAHEVCAPDGSLAEVVHRDVSPNNIMIDRYGQVKIVDFGIAKARDRWTNETTTGHAKGTLRFMAREQALGQAVDRRADIWAAGAVLFYVLAGEHPFAAQSPLGSLRRVMNGEDPEPLPPSVPREVRDIVVRALRHDPQERFPSAAEMQSALLAALARAGGADRESLATVVSRHLAALHDERDKLLSGVQRIPEATPAAQEPRAVGAPDPVPVLAGVGSAEPAQMTTGATAALSRAPALRSRARGAYGWIVAIGLVATGAAFAFWSAGFRREGPAGSAEEEPQAPPASAPASVQPDSAGEDSAASSASSPPLPPASEPPSPERVPLPTSTRPAEPATPSSRVPAIPPSAPSAPGWLKDYGF